MREILFRGKTKDGEWVYWNELGVINFDLTDTEISLYAHLLNDELMFETVGQYTGLTDMNGKKIFEGDILAEYFGEIYGVVKYGEGSFDGGILKYTGFYCESSSIFHDGNLCDESNKDYWNKHQVIGNIYDNPELLGE